MAKRTNITLVDIERAVNDLYLIADPGVIRIILATIEANRLKYSDIPVWLILLAASSGGKSALIKLLDKLSFIYTIDTLTTNTFASSMVSQTKENSLLHRANGGVLVFKDFTTLTSMNEEALKEIFGQLRGIYDGKFDKQSGNGNNVEWKGKIGIIAGGTFAVQRKLRQFSEQGERFINYCIEQPERIAMTRRAMQIQTGLAAAESALQDMILDFITETEERVKGLETVLPQELIEDIVEVSNFATMARSPVIHNRKTGKIEYVPEAEMPARVATKLSNLAVALAILHPENKMDNVDRRALFKIGFDSIPVERLKILKLLTQYRTAETKVLAINLNLPTDPVHHVLEDLNAIKLVDRVAKVKGNSDGWGLHQNFRDLMTKYLGIKQESAVMENTPEEQIKYESLMGARQNEVDEQMLDRIYSDQQPTLIDGDDPFQGTGF